MKIIIETVKFGRIDIIDTQDIKGMFLKENTIEIEREGDKNNFIIEKGIHFFPVLVDIESLFFKLTNVMDMQFMNIVLCLQDCCEWPYIIDALLNEVPNGSKRN